MASFSASLEHVWSQGLPNVFYKLNLTETFFDGQQVSPMFSSDERFRDFEQFDSEQGSRDLS